MNADALAFLASKGLGLDEIIEFARIAERKKDLTNAERQARHRAKKRGHKVPRYSNGVTPIERNIHTHREDISPDGESLSDCEPVVSAWNDMAKPIGLAACNAISAKRRAACRARLRDYGLPSVLKAIEHVPRSAFLRGETGKWSGANIDFLLKPETINKILEGQYDDRQASPQSARSPANDELQNPYVRVVAARQADRASGIGGESGGWP